MSRPEIIAKIHEAKYELQFALFGKKEELQSRYKALLDEGAREYKCSTYELRQVLREDYGIWVRENKLPRPPRSEPGLFVKDRCWRKGERTKRDRSVVTMETIQQVKLAASFDRY